jgi:hypothetical protein
MDQKFMQKQASHLFGLPEEEMKITKLKRTREIEMEQMELGKESQSDNRELGEKKLKIDAKKAEKPAAAPKKK